MDYKVNKENREITMATIKSFTDISQSKKLAEILPSDSADMWWPWYSDPVLNNGHYDDFPMFYKPVCNPNESVPCWSLSALLSVLPEGYSSVLTRSFNGKDYYCKLDGKHIETMADNPIDACYEMIMLLNELNELKGKI